MNHQYILFRNNKQSGPYLQQDLLHMDIYSTDLVWIQGNSSTWQPVETINELKHLLRPVINQSAIDLNTVTSSSAAFITTSTKEFIKPTMPDLPHTLNHVYVSFPVTIQESVYEEMDVEKNGNSTDNNNVEQRNKNFENPVASIERMPSGGNIIENSSYRSLEEIKNEYTLWVKGNKHQTKRNFSKKKAGALLFAITVLSLTIIAWKQIKSKPTVINSTPNYHANDVYEKIRPAVKTKLIESAKPILTRTTPVTKAQVNTTSLIINPDESISSPLIEELKNENIEPSIAHVEVSTAAQPMEERIGSNEKITAIIPGSKKTTIETSFPQTAPDFEKQTNDTPPLTSLVDVKGTYTSNKRNGITSLTIVVNNRSNKVLTLVAVDVCYYKSNQDFIGKRTLYFSNVKPGAEVSLNAAANSHAQTADFKLGLVSNGEAITYAKH